MNSSTTQIGDIIKVETTYDEQIVGEIFCYDKNASLLKIEDSDDYDIVMLKQDYIKNIEVLKRGKMEDIVLPALSISTISKKEKEIEREIRTRQIPKTSPYGNYVFAHLSKFAGCQWVDDVIVVDGNVRIANPYGLDSISGEEKAMKSVKEWHGKMK